LSAFALRPIMPQWCSGEEDMMVRDGLSRRDVLLTATVAAGTLAGVSSVRANPAAATAFGAPLVEVQVPAGILTLEQKSAMISGITTVIRGAMKQPPDPASRLFVQIIETADGGFGVDGRVFVPRGK
jgi:4-oxalocrotonate tautomerase